MTLLTTFAGTSSPPTLALDPPQACANTVGLTWRTAYGYDVTVIVGGHTEVVSGQSSYEHPLVPGQSVVVQVGFAEFDVWSDSYAVVAPPAVSVSAPTTPDRTVTFSADGAHGYDLWLDGSLLETGVSSPYLLSNLPDGTRTVQVRAYSDSAGSCEVSAQATFEVLARSITLSTPDSCVSATTLSWQTPNDDPVTVKVAGQVKTVVPGQAGGNSYVLGLQAGDSVTVQVGFAEFDVWSDSFTVIAPPTDLVVAVNDGKVTFSATGAQWYDLWIDHARHQPGVGSPYTLPSDLEAGSHTVQVRAYAHQNCHLNQSTSFEVQASYGRFRLIFAQDTSSWHVAAGNRRFMLIFQGLRDGVSGDSLDNPLRYPIS